MLLDDPNYAEPPTSEVIPGLEAARKQVNRILASDALHGSDVLRKLLKFLADKTFSGEANELKEYSVGLDALGKPPSYDPRQDAVVRLQASRLRQKLDEYYRNEGREDSLVIELPRGRFKLAWRPRAGESVAPAATPLAAPVAPLPEPVVPLPAVETRSLKIWRSLAIGLAVTSLALAFVSIRPLSPRTIGAKSALAGPSPDLDALWSPFLSSAHHLVIAFINPLFVRLQREGSPDIIYRTRGNNSWNDAVTSPEFSALIRALGKASPAPTFNMVERSSLVSTFALSQFFASRRGDISLARSVELSWQQFAENDVIMLGPVRLDQGLSGLPVRPALIVDKTGIRNLEPLAGDPPVYADPPDHQESDGEGLELVSVLPGPLGRTTVMTFSSNHAWGVTGGVQSLTDPAFAHVLVTKLKEPSGKIPPYYQIVFRIRYRDGTPTNASYVTHRVLALAQNSGEPDSPH